MSFNKTTRNRIIAVAMAVAMILCLIPIWSSDDIYAATTKEQIASIQKQQSALTSELSTLTKEVEEKEAAIEELQTKLDDAEKKLTETEKEIESTSDSLNARVRAMYKNGGVGYIDILLGSSDLSEFISNIDMVQRIYSSDQNTLSTLQENKEAIEKEKSEIEAQKKEVDEAKAELDKKVSEMKEKISSLKSQQQKLADQLAKESSSYSQPSSYSGGKFIWPVSGTITCEWGTQRSYERHPGMDIAVSYGTPVKAAAAGTVILATTFGGYGYCVIISHGSGLYTLYGHNSRLAVSAGTSVSQGQVIAYAGSTGWSTGTHVHFEVRVGKGGINANSFSDTRNPRSYL